MSIEALADHRTKLLAMKATLLGTKQNHYYAHRLDGDIRACDDLIRLAIEAQKPRCNACHLQGVNLRRKS